ncbi:MAG: NADH-quinone oxidoreductase subunit NuoG [bacterium]
MAEPDITFTLNGRTLTAHKGETVLAAALRAGIHIPHFCYHKYLSIVGQCRACLVEVLDAGNGRAIPKLQTSCSTPVAEGMKVSSGNERVLAAHESVFEFLLKNHPLDCPVCDQGGECPLQDQTMAYARALSRTHEVRRTYPPKEINPYIRPDMNRCVHCTCCIRFSQEIDGGGEFGWANRGDRTEVGIFADLPLSSIVSGNVIDICPVGALTDEKYRFTARVWEMEDAEGPCTLCSVGCRQRVWTMDGEIKRVTAGENPAVNDTWICDVGRFGWSAVHGLERIRQPMIREGGALRPASWEEAFGEAARRFAALAERGGGAAIAGLGGAWGANEDALQFGAFVRTVLGSNHLDCRVHPRDIAQSEAQRAAFGAVGGFGSIKRIGRAKTVLLVGADPFEEHPILALQARKAHREGATLISLHPRRIDLRVHSRMIHLTPLPGQEARVLRALARALADAGARVEGEGAEGYRAALAGADPAALCREAGADAEDLAAAARALGEGGAAILAGPGVRDSAAAAEAVNLANLLEAEILFAPAEPNMQGALDMGLHPEILPGGRPLSDAGAREACAAAWGRALPDAPGLSSEGILGSLAGKWEGKGEEGRVRALYLFGADPVGGRPDGARAALEAAEFVVLHASHTSASMAYADVVFPAPTLYEEEGTVTSLERRVQRLGRALRPALDMRVPEPWRVFAGIARAMERPMKGASLERIQRQAAQLAPDYADALARLPGEGALLRRSGRGALRPAELPPARGEEGGLRLVLSPALWLSGPFFSSAYHLWDMPGAALRLSPPDADRIGIGEGEEAEFELGGRTVRLPARVDATLPVGLAWAPEGTLRALGGEALSPGGAPDAGGVSIRVRAAARAGSEA